MPDYSSHLQSLRRYADMIEQRMRAIGSDPSIESAPNAQVERGTVLARCLLENGPQDQSLRDALIDPFLELIKQNRVGSTRIADRAGHSRSAYLPLLSYCFIQSFHVIYESIPPSHFGRWDEAVRSLGDLLEARLTSNNWAFESTATSRGAAAAEAAWTSLALHVAGKMLVRDAWTDLAAATFGQLVGARPGTGAFLSAASSDNPETLWYHELVILHAAASYAVQAEDRTVAASVKQATEFFQDEVQPDHATCHPWALFAFIWNPQCQPFADQLLHNLNTQDPQAADGISLMLLADALYCLRLFL